MRLEAVTQAAVDIALPAALAKHMTIHTAFDSNVPAVNGDAERLQQAIWNLLSNAVKFTAAGGRIEVRIRSDGESVVLSVRDTGQGIGRDFLPYVFDPFRQADASTSRRHGGLGLLALVRQIVELHGGTVAADSPGADQGATFEIRLPAAAAAIPDSDDTSSHRPVTFKGVSLRTLARRRRSGAPIKKQNNRKAR